MADWTHVPKYAYVESVEPPPTLIDEYEDGSEDRRQKGTKFRRSFVEQHTVDSATMSAMITFFKSKGGALTTFTKVSYDPEEPAATEATVRFKNAPLEFTWKAVDEFEVEISFREVL